MNAKNLHDQHHCFARGIRLLLCGATLGVASTAFAVCTPTASNPACLADQPIQSTSIVKPNVLFVLDNSGSMVWDLMSVDSGLDENKNRTQACRKNYQYNTVYYNPNIDYSAAIPRNSLNASMGSQTFTAARVDPFRSATVVNLSTAFCAVSARCSAADASPDLRPQNAYYYKKIAGASGSSCDTDNAHYVKVRVGIDNCTVGGDVTTCAGGADERTNFANWYSYNRTRILMMKSGMSTAFSTIDDKMRVGFHTINNPDNGSSAGRSLNVDDFAATQKNDWYTALWSINPSGGTPLREALARAGNYYSNSGTRTGLTGDPVQYSCQKNFTILSTDGYWNGNSPGVGNTDSTIPAAMPIKAGNTVYDPANTGLTEGALFPYPYREGATASNTLADVAMSYWVRDLRTTGAVSANNVPTLATDPAYWQHMNTFTVGLGVDGTLSFPGSLAALNAGATLWPAPTADTLTAVDDLWHAAINGRGQYYRATDPTTLSNSLNAALKAVTDVPSFDAGPAASTNDFRSPDQSDYTTYATSYRVINWSGDVDKFNLDRTSGEKTGGSLWSAAKQLDLKVNPSLSSSVDPIAFKTRNIVTRREDGTVVEFTFPTLSTTQQKALCYRSGPYIGEPDLRACIPADTSVVDYLRGEAQWEGKYGVGSSRFRDRHDETVTSAFRRSILGSIVNSAPAYVASEVYSYIDPGYAAYKTASKTRAGTLYVGANDGMLHALNAATGNELWAYVPSFVIPEALDESGKQKGLRALSFQDSGAPAFNHHFYVDGPLKVSPVDFLRTGGPITGTSPSGDWRTLLVGGLGKGGKGYFAVDVTTPASDLASAKSKVLWEFPSAADPSHAAVISGGLLGYSFGQPVIVKSHSYGWVVLLPSGHNNTDSNGYVFVLNAKTGALLETLKTPASAPGLAHITALVNFNNRFAQYVYGGDLNGTLWRFDLGDSPVAARTVTKLLASSNNTPITTEPNVSIDRNTDARWVFFGTGQYLDVPDRATTGGQYLVALRDGTLSTPKLSGLPVSLSALSPVANLLVGISSPALGWRYSLPASGERNALKPTADLQTIVFASLIPTTDPCSPGVTGSAYALDYSTGQSRMMINNALVPFYYSSTGIASTAILMTGAKTGTSGSPGVVITGRDGVTVKTKLDTRGISGTRHVGWRESLSE